MKKGILLTALSALLLAACEKEEKVVKDDGVVHCPVHWATNALELIAAQNGSAGCLSHTAKIEGGAMNLDANVGEANILVVAQSWGKHNGRAFSIEGDFNATVELSPLEASEGSAFTFQINSPTAPVGFDYAESSIFRSPHALTIVRQADGYHFKFDAELKITESFAPLADFHRARLSMVRQKTEGRDDVVLKVQVFDQEGKMLAGGERATPISPGILVPVFKLHVLYNAPGCLAAKWRILRYDYTGGGLQVSDDFHCNTIFQ